jgi:UDP-glucose 4-epimerase
MLRRCRRGPRPRPRHPALFRRRRSDAAHRPVHADATHLIKVAVETVLGRRARMNVYGTDYPTPDGTRIRDYFFHVTDLVHADADTLAYLRAGGQSVTLNRGYGHGLSVLDVIDTVKRVSGVDFPVDRVGPRPGDPAQIGRPSDRRRPRQRLSRPDDVFPPGIAHAR